MIDNVVTLDVPEPSSSLGTETVKRKFCPLGVREQQMSLLVPDVSLLRSSQLKIKFF